MSVARRATFTMTVGDPLGWRVWRVFDGHLVGPFGGDVLAFNGYLSAPPCSPIQLRMAGVSYFDTAENALAAVDGLDARDELAVTVGAITGPTMPDANPSIYRVGNTFTSLPWGRRCQGYRVQQIFTDVTEDLSRYNVPVHGLVEL